VTWSQAILQSYFGEEPEMPEPAEETEAGSEDDLEFE